MWRVVPAISLLHTSQSPGDEAFQLPYDSPFKCVGGHVGGIAVTRSEQCGNRIGNRRLADTDKMIEHERREIRERLNPHVLRRCPDDHASRFDWRCSAKVGIWSSEPRCPIPLTSNHSDPLGEYEHL